MRHRVPTALAGASLLVLATALSAHAQSTSRSESSTQRLAQVDAGAPIEEVTVTARRRAENVENVPVAVSAVTSDQIEKLELLNMSDITNVVTGLTIAGADISMRGVSYNTFSEATTQPTVATYINDAPVNSVLFNQNLYDVGQVEVLRGPQGTLHGISTPSGAITFTTRKPEMNDWGATANVTVSDYDAHNLQFALNVPIIDNMLAIRVAGLQGETEGTGAGEYVTSVNSAAKPDTQTDSERVSIAFQPADNFTANVMYQHIEQNTVDFASAVFGTGAAVNPVTHAVGYNGGTIGAFQRLAVASGPNLSKTPTDILTGELGWTFDDQKLTYVGSWQRFDLKAPEFDGDPANLIPGYQLQGDTIPSLFRVDSHELRLASVDPLFGGMLDYVVGAFHSVNKVVTDGSEVISLTPGAFGAGSAQLAPGPYAPTIPNLRYSTNVNVDGPSTTTETSLFANLTGHIFDNLEVSAGGRYIMSKINTTTTVIQSPLFAAVDIPMSLCNSIPTPANGVTTSFGATYPGICDVDEPGKSDVPVLTDRHTHYEWIYSGSISYHVDPDLMLYVNTGTSWRNGPINIGVNNADNLPAITALTFQPPESSTSYEAGAKWLVLDRRGVLNADVYEQKFTGLVYTVPFAVNYFDCTTSCGTGQYPAFNLAVPAKVYGVDTDATFDIMEGWNASARASYQYGKVSGTLPCNNASKPLTAANPVNFCSAGNLSSSVAPPWNFDIQSEYDHSLMFVDNVDGFIRGLFNFYARNPYANETYTVPSYGMLNLYVGAHASDGRWEISLFSTNLTDTRHIVTEAPQQILAPASSPQLAFTPNGTGYTTVTVTPPRVIGINLRYLFGGG